MSKFSDSQLLRTYLAAGRTEQEFLSALPLSLDDTEETQLTAAGVDLTSAGPFLRRTKAIVGPRRFSEWTGEYRDRLLSQRNGTSSSRGRRIKNPTGNFIGLVLSRIAKDPSNLALGPITQSVKPAPTPIEPPCAPVISLRDKRLLKRIELADRIAAEPAFNRNKIAFNSRVLVQANLPHSDPGPIEFWRRQNGRFIFILQPGANPQRDGRTFRAGCPYGSVPRLALIHLASEAIRTRNRRISLGSSFYGYLKALGISDSSPNYAMVREQLTRLFIANIQFIWADSTEDAKRHVQKPAIDARRNCAIASNFALWWSPRSEEDQPELFTSHVTLEHDFYEEIIAHGFPLDFDAIAALKRSPLALDLYSWLVWKMVDLRRPVVIPWGALHEQFGADYVRIRKFREKLISTAEKVACYWRGGLHYKIAPEGLEIAPSQLPVERRSRVHTMVSA